jgi:hypothetical protein
MCVRHAASQRPVPMQNFRFVEIIIGDDAAITPRATIILGA